MAKTTVPIELSSTPGIVDNSNATAITIDSSENVGIGTSSPAHPLQVRRAGGAGSLGISIDNVGSTDRVAQYFAIQDDATGNGAGHAFYSRAAGSTTDTLTLMIDENQRVGIGTSSPSVNLEITESGSATNSVADVLRLNHITSGTAASGLGAGIVFASERPSGGINLTRGAIYGISGSDPDDDGALAFYTRTDTSGGGFTEKVRVTSGGNVGVGTSSPSNTLTLSSGTNDGRQLKLIGTSNNALIKFDNGDTAQEYSMGLNGSAFIVYDDTNSAYRLTLDSSGNLGIGTSSPSHALDIVAGSTNFPVQFNADGSSYFGYLYSDSGGSGMFNGGTIAGSEGIYLDNINGVFRFYTNGSEKMRLDSSGNFIIGGTGVQAVDSVSFANATNGVTFDNNTASTAGNGHEFQTFRRNSTQIGSITMNGTTGVTYNTSSDARLKDITGEARGLEVINALNPVAYNWKADGQSDEGLIAQEVEEIVPNAVSQNKEEYYQMDYSKLVVHLVKGMKEQQEQIESLKSEIKLLKGGN